MTALMAIFSIEQGAHLGGIGPMTSCGSRFVAFEHTRDALRRRRHDRQPIAELLSQNQSFAASQLSSTSMRGEVRFMELNLRFANCNQTRRSDFFVPVFLLPPCGEGLRKGVFCNVFKIAWITPSLLCSTSLFQNRRTENPEHEARRLFRRHIATAQHAARHRVRSPISFPSKQNLRCNFLSVAGGEICNRRSATSEADARVVSQLQ